MTTDTSLITFKAICNFTNDLSEVFGENHRPLKLYAHLINKTTLSHEQAIKKHIEAFHSFCVKNREAISSKNIKAVNETKIEYSSRVYINMKEIFELADKETTGVIWKHLLTISALVDPSGKARRILKEQKENGGGDEVNFLSDIIAKVEDKVNPDANPMEAVTSIMQSGIFNDLVQGMGSGLQNGSLDLNKLMGTVQNMVTKLSDDAGDKEGGEQAVNMLSTMMGSMNAGRNAPDNDGTPQPMPDLAGMMGPLMGMMGGMVGGGSNSGGMPDLSGMMSGMMGAMANMNNEGVGENEGSSNAIEDQINAQLRMAKENGSLPQIQEIENDDIVPLMDGKNSNSQD